jgi:succinate dehydrogenase flavin-adding protein (antitoxin of CptAB toxin-antitoxin module)
LLALGAVFCVDFVMDFPTEIRKWSAADIVRVIGCPERTAYSWIMGEKFPPEWAQRLVLAKLKGRPTRRQSQ